MDASSRTFAATTLDCLSDPAILLSDTFEILAANEAYRQTYAGGQKVVGRHCYEVSHHFMVPCGEAGESCPLEQCRTNGENSRAVHVHYTPRGEEHQDVQVRPVPRTDGETTCFIEVLQPSKIATVQPRGGRLVGRSPAFNHMVEMIGRVASTETSVLLLGESGTGKEIVARAVHELSPRSDNPFVPVDCSGLAETLFESELFGHEKGAFTGADCRKRGLIEAARGGTLFLDELGDIPLSLQVKLLRLLETGRYRRVGSADQERADFRLICATHRDLERMIQDGSFRQDLYYRISAFPVHLPPLRDRLEDVPLLIKSLRPRLRCLGECNIHPETLDALCSYHYPGNVRELLNILERACLLTDGDSILPDHLPNSCRGGTASMGIGEVVTLEEAQERYLRWAVASFRGDNRELARKLGLSERTLYRKLQRIRGNGHLTG